jgi:flagellar assembly protein FliH
MLSRIVRAGSGGNVEPLVWPAAAVGPTLRTPRLDSCDTSAGEAERAARRRAELEHEIERVAREARQAGYREGESAGRACAAAELQPVLDRLARSIEEIASLRPRLLRESEAELVELSLGIARRILRREVSLDPNALRALVTGALDQIGAEDACRVRVHPELEAAVRQSLERKCARAVQVSADASLEPGGILLETSRGKLDASLETQLAEIGRGLADRLP